MSTDNPTPRQIGESIGTVFHEMLRRFSSLVDGYPPPPALRESIAELKEATIQELMPLGRLRDALDEAERQQVDMASSMALRRTDPQDFETFQKATAHYRTLDNDFANEIAAFNIITQYACFELLRTQAPDEASRLGLGEDS
jgi:hypothetical protein